VEEGVGGPSAAWHRRRFPGWSADTIEHVLMRDDRCLGADAPGRAAEAAAAWKISAGRDLLVAANVFWRCAGVDDVAQRPRRSRRTDHRIEIGACPSPCARAVGSGAGVGA